MAVAAIGSCATTPRAGVPEEIYLSALPADRAAYLTLDVANLGEIVPPLAAALDLPVAKLEAALGRVTSVYAAADGLGTQTPRYWALVLGKFPTIGLGVALPARDGWRRVPGSPARFENSTMGVQIGVLERGVLAVSNGGLSEIALGDPSRPPDVAWSDVVDLGRDADLVVYFPRVPDALATLAGSAAGNVRRIWLRMRPLGGAESVDETPLELDLGFVMAGEREARLFRPVLRLLLLGLARQGRLPGGTAALSDVRDESSGELVSLAGIRLTASETLTFVRELTGGAEEGKPVE